MRLTNVSHKSDQHFIYKNGLESYSEDGNVPTKTNTLSVAISEISPVFTFFSVTLLDFAYQSGWRPK